MNNLKQKSEKELLKFAQEALKSLKEFVKMYEAVQPSGGYQGVYDTGKYLINQTKIKK